MLRRCALILLVVGLPAAARGEDRRRAAEHFARAQAAEKRRDWRAAIDEYEEAYHLSPHASVLYNIALNHERLSAWRQAGRFFIRYLDEAPEAEDRDLVLARVRGLRARPSSVTIETRPGGASVLVDGVVRGHGPVLLALTGGRGYQIEGAYQGRRSRAQEIVPEYGEPVSLVLEVDIDAAMGAPPPEDSPPIAISDGGAAPAEVASGPAPVIASPAPLTPAAGGGHKLLTAAAYGYHSGGHGPRYSFALGYRTPGDLLEIGFLSGLFGGMTALGGEARLYLGSAAVRPYLRGAGLIGWQPDREGARALEAGLGVLIATTPADRVAGGIGIDTFVEIAGHRRAADGDGVDEADGSSLAIMAGLGARFGR